jgi:hypothetical protein
MDGRLLPAFLPGAPFNIGVPPTFPYTDPVSGAVTTASYASILRMDPDGSGLQVYATGEADRRLGHANAYEFRV